MRNGGLRALVGGGVFRPAHFLYRHRLPLAVARVENVVDFAELA